MQSKHSVWFGLAAGMALAASPALAADGKPANPDMKPKKIESMQPTTPEPRANRGMPELGTEKPAQDAPRSDVGDRNRQKVDPMRDGTPVRANAKEYTVEKGDTLGDIAEKRLGSRDQWRVIAKANGIDDPAKLRVGQKLRIPEKGPQ